MLALPESAGLSQLSAWGNFYVIVGSSAGALTGLQFVVMALLSSTRMKGTMAEIRAFGTPTIVHFCAVLLISAVMSAPWTVVTSVAMALRLLGVAGVIYALIVIRRTRRQSGYQPVLEDWLWHGVFPLISYLCIITAAIVLNFAPTIAFFTVAIAELLLLFIGIHNSWDTVTYIVIEKGSDGNQQELNSPADN